MADTTYQPDTPRNRGDDDAPHLSPVTPAEDARTVMINKISWGAVLAGVVVALVTQLILNMIGIGIGAGTLDPGAGAGENPTASGFSIGAGIWWTLSGILAALAGGYAAGRLAGQPKESTAGWHGLTAWALTTLVVFYLLTSTLGGLVGGAFRTVTNAAGGAVQTAAQAAGPTLASRVTDPFASIEQELRGGGDDPQSLRDSAVAAVRAAVTGDEAGAAEARGRAAEALARAQNIPVDEANARVAQLEQQYRQTVETTRREATEAADTAASAVSRGALFGSVALVLGALAGWFGGRLGAVEPTVTGRLGLGTTTRGTTTTSSTSTVAGSGTGSRTTTIVPGAVGDAAVRRT